MQLRVVTLRNLSLGGFSIETDTDVPPGIEVAFEFHASGLLVDARAIAVHCRLAEAGGRRYISGWSFVDDNETQEAIAEVIDVLTASLRFVRVDE